MKSHKKRVCQYLNLEPQERSWKSCKCNPTVKDDISVNVLDQIDEARKSDIIFAFNKQIYEQAPKRIERRRNPPQIRGNIVLRKKLPRIQATSLQRLRALPLLPVKGRGPG